MQGEIVFDAGGKRYTLFIGNAAQCDIEEQYDKGFFAIVTDAMPIGVPAHVALNPDQYPEEIMAASRQLRMSVIRDLAWHGLRKHHPELQQADISNLIDEMGQGAFGEIIGRAIFASRDTGAGNDAAPKKPSTRAHARTGPPVRKSGRKPN
jgi:hypothetical protein